MLKFKIDIALSGPLSVFPSFFFDSTSTSFSTALKASSLYFVGIACISYFKVCYFLQQLVQKDSGIIGV